MRAPNLTLLGSPSLQKEHELLHVFASLSICWAGSNIYIYTKNIFTIYIYTFYNHHTYIICIYIYTLFMYLLFIYIYRYTPYIFRYHTHLQPYWLSGPPQSRRPLRKWHKRHCPRAMDHHWITILLPLYVPGEGSLVKLCILLGSLWSSSCAFWNFLGICEVSSCGYFLWVGHVNVGHVKVGQPHPPEN